jgi:hypothetical protein
MRSILAFSILAACVTVSAPALATSSVSVVNSSCSLAAGCLFTGNVAPNTIGDIQTAYNALPGADITLNYLGSTGDNFDGNGKLSGTWSLPGFDVNYIAVKAGNQFILYSLAQAASSGVWSTAGLLNPNGRTHPQLGLSHLAFFGNTHVVTPPPAGAVPEPASWAMMLGGFGLVGAALRNRRRNTAVSFG